MDEFDLSKLQRRNSRAQQKYQQRGRRFAVLCTVLFHCLIFLSFTYSIITPQQAPQEKLIIEFIPDKEVPKPIQVKAGNEPKAENPTSTKEVRLVQKSQGTKIAQTTTKNSSESELGDFGDVNKYEPPKKPAINKKALFTAPKHNKDSLAEQTSSKISDALAAGHTQGNTAVGNTEGTPMAKLKGRNVEGALPFPEYKVNKGGKVVVKILVDQYGTVINATPGAAGTTVQDKVLWDAAKKAALAAKFNVSSTAQTVQEGTITYTFTLE